MLFLKKGKKKLYGTKGSRNEWVKGLFVPVLCEETLKMRAHANCLGERRVFTREKGKDEYLILAYPGRD